MSNQVKAEKGAPARAAEYALGELCRAEKRLGAPSDVIRAALLEKGVESATLEEARAVVEAFKTRKVK